MRDFISPHWHVPHPVYPKKQKDEISSLIPHESKHGRATGNHNDYSSPIPGTEPTILLFRLSLAKKGWRSAIFIVKRVVWVRAADFVVYRPANYRPLLKSLLPSFLCYNICRRVPVDRYIWILCLEIMSLNNTPWSRIPSLSHHTRTESETHHLPLTSSTATHLSVNICGPFKWRPRTWHAVLFDIQIFVLYTSSPFYGTTLHKWHLALSYVLLP